ncbi:MAG: pre-peptidase C-terminal domain-containing protein [Isosphaeraceae bacterium]|nr:pre-peptidase C-terminal domain-containing protein [Isosphaeraceae bacterium]
MRAPLLGLLAVFVFASSADAISPSVTSISPVGGRRGTEVSVTITGRRLADAEEFVFYGPGVRVQRVEPVDETTCKATFAIAPDAALGLHDFRLRTRTGISGLKTFSVGSLPESNEIEPNNDFAKPQAIAMNTTINGVAGTEDIDYYAVKVKKGERISVEIEGIRLGLTLFDPAVSILDERRFELATSDDSALIWQDGFVSILAPADGTYIISAREAAYRGNGLCLYRLHVGGFPRPTATLPAGGKLGDSIDVGWIGDLLGEKSSRITLPTLPDRHFGLLASDERGTAPYPNLFRLSPFGNTLEQESNDRQPTATTFTPPTALNGVISTAGDIDHFTFTAKKDQTLDLRVFARQIRSPLDPVLTVFDKKGGRVGLNDDSGGPDSYLRFRAPRDGEYILAVADHLKKGGPDYVYRVEIAPSVPKLTLATASESLRRGGSVQAIAVPRGNRQAIVINATRTDFSGAVSVSASDLPAGASFRAGPMGPSIAQIPVLFEAGSDAPLGASLATLEGKVVDSSDVTPGSEFLSTSELVLGQNNRPFWTRTVEKLAVAVTEEAPFSIELIEPRVPIVRGGAMELKVVAKRKPGFTAPIAVSLPWNPPGISSKAEGVIPENQSEGKILINASGNAELNTWQILADATYVEPPPAGTTNRRGFRGGRLTVSSGFAKLTVVAPYLAFRYSPVSVEQGQEVVLPVKVTQSTPFEGEAKAVLVGLPNRVTAEPILITKEMTELAFKIKTDPASPPGDNKNLFCQVVIMKDGEPILHNLYGGRLRVDAPAASKKPGSVGVAAAKPATATDDKPLSRLEKLRLESKERAKAAEAAGGM